MPLPRYLRSVMSSRVVAAVLVVIVAALAPMAWAATVDQTKFTGFYDAAHQDEAVLSVLSIEGQATPLLAFCTAPRESRERKAVEPPLRSGVRWAEPVHDRAPPSR